MLPYRQYFDDDNRPVEAVPFVYPDEDEIEDQPDEAKQIRLETIVRLLQWAAKR